MEKSYRDLFEIIETTAKSDALKEFLNAIGEVDDTDPLRSPVLRAMKRVPPPPINMLYSCEEGKLRLYARNTVRKRKAAQPALCAEIPAYEWLFTESGFPEADLALRDRCLELVRRSFGYLEMRIANYFEVGHDTHLAVKAGQPTLLCIEQSFFFPRAVVNEQAA